MGSLARLQVDFWLLSGLVPDAVYNGYPISFFLLATIHARCVFSKAMIYLRNYNVYLGGHVYHICCLNVYHNMHENF